MHQVRAIGKGIVALGLVLLAIAAIVNGFSALVTLGWDWEIATNASGQFFIAFGGALFVISKMR